jgi:hypothetical protein
MVKNKKNNNNDSYDEQIEHLFMSKTKASSNRKQGMENEKKPKILDELEVENYSHILYPIEFAIASHHVENPATTDKMILKEITSLVRRHSDGQSDVGSNIWKKVKIPNVANTNSRSTITMENCLTTALKQAAIQGLQEGPITREEFLFCLGYVTYCIDNRSWIQGGRGYLDWIANWFGLLEGRKKQEFDSFYDDLSKILGIEKGFLKDEHYT